MIDLKWRLWKDLELILPQPYQSAGKQFTSHHAPYLRQLAGGRSVLEVHQPDLPVVLSQPGFHSSPRSRRRTGWSTVLMNAFLNAKRSSSLNGISGHCGSPQDSDALAIWGS